MSSKYNSKSKRKTKSTKIWNPNKIKLDSSKKPNALSPFYSFSNHWSYLSKQYLCLSTWGTCCGGVNEQYDTILDEEASINIYEKHYIEKINKYLNDPKNAQNYQNQQNLKNYDDDSDFLDDLNDGDDYLTSKQQQSQEPNLRILVSAPMDTNNTTTTNVSNYYNITNNNNAPPQNIECQKKCEKKDTEIAKLKKEIEALKQKLLIQENMINNKLTKESDDDGDGDESEDDEYNQYNKPNRYDNQQKSAYTQNDAQQSGQSTAEQQQQQQQSNEQKEELSAPQHKAGQLSFGSNLKMWDSAAQMKRRNTIERKKWDEERHKNKDVKEFKPMDNNGVAYVETFHYAPAAHSIVTDPARRMSAAEHSSYMKQKEDKNAIILNDEAATLPVKAKLELYTKLSSQESGASDHQND